MKKINIIYLLALLVCTSCADFLDEQPRHEQTLETAVQDYAGAQHVITGMYSTMKTGWWGGKIFVALSCQAGMYNNGYYTQFYNMSYRQEDFINADGWTAWYKSLNAANAAYQSVSGLAESKFPSAERKREMLAEIRLFRAWVHTNLLWCYGHWWAADNSPYGILYKDEVTNVANLQTARLTVGESYKKIFEDLDEAISYAPEYVSAKYLSRTMAKVLKAKILLNRGRENDYKDALTLVEDVIATAPAGFKMEPDMKKVYEDAWDSPEVLWARYLDEGNGSKSRTYTEYDYSAGLYNYRDFYPRAEDWLTADPRYEVMMDSARGPEKFQTQNEYVMVKLYHQGRIVGPNDKYAAYFFRYPELLLMKAELTARLKPADWQKALGIVNDMRSRRTNPVLPDMEASSYEEFMDKLFQEYWIETCLENGNEWFAALRFQKDNKPWIYTLKTDVQFSENNYCWPIPEDEIKNNQLMEQNPELK